VACTKASSRFAKVKGTSTGKLLDSLPRNDAVAGLCYGKFNVAYNTAVILRLNYQNHHFHSQNDFIKDFLLLYWVKDQYNKSYITALIFLKTFICTGVTVFFRKFTYL
jgi:hypothetical protein